MAVIDPNSPNLCRKIISSFFYQRPLIQQKMEERLAASRRVITLAIPDKGVVSQYENSDDVRFRAAKQTYSRYRTIAPGPAALVEGQMPARDCAGNTALMDASVDVTNINACNGVQQWNFAHGFATRTSEDMSFAYKSPVICIEQYAQQGPDRVKAFFSLLMDEFAKFGPDNYEANLRQMVIKYGESNMSITGSANHFAVTTNGWEAPPKHLLAIPALERYRQYMMGVEDGVLQDETDVLEISAPRREWFAAVADDILRTSGPAVCLDVRPYTDERSAFYKKASHEYKNIRCIFDEEPEKGYFKANGTSGGKQLYTFVPVYPWRNVRGETIQGAADGGGIVAERNPEYWQDFVYCNGQRHRMCIISWSLNSKAFERYRISPTMAPAGVNPVGTNFEVEIRDGADVPCNDLHNQFFMISQHKARFKIRLPKLAGAIIYLSEPQGIAYVRDGCVDESTGTADDTPATYDPLTTQGPDLCQIANCDSCADGKVPDNNGNCVANADGLFVLDPCAVVDVIGDSVLRVRVYRNGNNVDAASVDIAVAAGTAVDGVNFTDPANATLSWDAGQGGYQDYLITILAADATNPKTFTVTLSNATGGASLSPCTVLTGTILPE